jgi:TnpA family transposase
MDDASVPRRTLLTDAQRAALLALPTDETALIRHYTLSDDDRRLIARRRRPDTRLGLALQLCAVRYPGRLLRPGEPIPMEVASFIAAQLDVPPDALANFARRAPTRYEQLGVLRRTYGLVDLTHPHRQELQDWLRGVALITIDGVAVVAALAEEMRRRRIIIPGVTVLERLAAEVISTADNRIITSIADRLRLEQRRRLDVLCEQKAHERQSRFAWIREPPGVAGVASFHALVDRLEAVRGLTLDPAVVADAPPARLRRLAREGRRYSAQALRKMRPPRRYAVLVATLLEVERDLTDAAVEMADALLGRAMAAAKRRREEALAREADLRRDTFRLLVRLGEELVAAHAQDGDLGRAVARVTDWEHLDAVIAAAGGFVRADEADAIGMLGAEHGAVRRWAPRFLEAFRFDGAPSSRSLLRAVALLRDAYPSKPRALPADAPVDFVTHRWKPHVAGPDGTIDRRYWGLAVLFALRDRLRAGDVWVRGARAYRALDEHLIPAATFAGMVRLDAVPVAVPLDVEAWLGERRPLLHERLRALAHRLGGQPSSEVRLAKGSLRVEATDTPEDRAALALAGRLDAVLPRIRLTDLLEEVDRWTGFVQLFEHAGTGRPPAEKRVFLATLIAEATNLGLARMAQVCPGMTRRQLVWTATWHLREENFAAALDRLVELQQKAPLAEVFGGGAMSSSDGQHFYLGGPGEAVGAVNARYGRDPAIKLYTHLSDRYAPFHVKVIAATAGEAAHVLDGLLHTRLGTVIVAHAADGGAVSDHVFGLCALLGYRFTPRIPRLDDRRLYAFEPRAAYGAAAPLIGERLDPDLIRGQWGELLRLAASVRTGTVSASLMLKRLGSYPRQNRLAAALRELGRIERTLWTLRWVEDPEVRRTTELELNKGEARNALARAVCLHRLGRFRDRSLESQTTRASALNLVIAAVILWNTAYLHRAVMAFRARGEVIDGALLARLAPLGWEHVALTGDYVWEEAPALDADGFRPLAKLS